jgi:hypothetical protein
MYATYSKVSALAFRSRRLSLSQSVVAGSIVGSMATGEVALSRRLMSRDERGESHLVGSYDDSRGGARIENCVWWNIAQVNGVQIIKST